MSGTGAVQTQCSCGSRSGIHKANGVEPYAYLTLILTDMQYMDRPFSNEELESFMPWSEELKDSIASRTRPVPLTEDKG